MRFGLTEQPILSTPVTLGASVHIANRVHVVISSESEWSAFAVATLQSFDWHRAGQKAGSVRGAGWPNQVSLG